MRTETQTLDRDGRARADRAVLLGEPLQSSVQVTIDGIDLVPEYEKVFLMEMVMAGNRSYLDSFQGDISSQRFDLIVTDPLFDTYKESGESWAEENNVWVEAVSVPVLCHYWRKITFPESGVQILAPRENPIDCNFALEAGDQD